ncbi:MAG: redoxin domain-containing protein [Anaerolineae bacterium]|nr:redoxin domain-containing protein [Anaerolineae bacterium]
MAGLWLSVAVMLVVAGCAPPTPANPPPIPTPRPLPTWTPVRPTSTPRPLGTPVVPTFPPTARPDPSPSPTAPQARPVAPVVGAQAPDFLLWDLEGNEVSLSRLRGHPVVLNFWASWCPPCRMEVPDLAAAYQAYKDQGVVFVGVNFLEDADRVREFVEWAEITFPVVLDLKGEVVSTYQVRALPSTFFIDKDGTIVQRYVGPMTQDLLDQYLAELLP